MYIIQRNWADEWSGCWAFRQRKAAQKVLELMHEFGEHQGWRMIECETDPTILLADISRPALARHEAMLYSLRWQQKADVMRQAAETSTIAPLEWTAAAKDWAEVAGELWAWAESGDLTQLHEEWDLA